MYERSTTDLVVFQVAIYLYNGIGATDGKIMREEYALFIGHKSQSKTFLVNV